MSPSAAQLGQISPFISLSHLRRRRRRLWGPRPREIEKKKQATHVLSRGQRKSSAANRPLSIRKGNDDDDGDDDDLIEK